MSVFSDINIPISNTPILTATQKKNLLSAGYNTIGDILANIPNDYEDRQKVQPLYHAIYEKKSLVQVQIISHEYRYLKRKGKLLVITIQDDSQVAYLHCYGREFLKRMLPPGKSVYIWGTFTVQFNKIIASSFEVISSLQAMSDRMGIIPKYRIPHGFSQITYAKMIKKIISHIDIDELHPYSHTISHEHSMSRQQAIHTIYMPKNMAELSLAQQYLAFDEILLFQLFLMSISHTATITKSETRKNKTKYASHLLSLLPFALTRGQEETLATLQSHLLGPRPMNTLLQGDVGSGKTLIALFCALLVIENGEQVALAVPSESLANQHFERIQTLLEPMSISVQLLTGSTKAKERKIALNALQEGDISLIVGTHALFSEDVYYNKLGFIIIDEQHRFGVEQRTQLIKKGVREHWHPDVLLMSATPIPRSLALTIYGSMSVVSLLERPAIQQPVQTRLIQYENRQKVYSRLKNTLERNEQVYIIFPQIDSSVTSNTTLLSVETVFPEIQEALAPHTCAILHSKIDNSEKVTLLQEFEQGKISVLVATTIIEVGIDIPNATSIVIFNAERFGLSTLHQLRGRVGRGSLPGEAILIFREPLQETAKQRLKIIFEETDGFIIAEKDMQLRGPGDIHQIGIRQSGSLLFQFFDAFHNIEETILAQTSQISKKIITQDPRLEKPEHSALHTILHTEVSS